MKKLLTIFSIILISLAVSAYSTGNSNAALYDTTRDTSAAAGIDTFIIASDTTTEFADSSYVFFKLSYGE